MKKQLRHITIFLLITNLLLAHVGVTVHWLYCMCKGEMATSLFAIKSDKHCESALMATTGCEAKTLKSCCQKFKKLSVQVEKKHQCERTGVDYFKADLQTIQKDSAKIAFPIFDAICSLSAVYTNFSYFIFQEKYTFFPSNKAPPRAYNRHLLALIQNFRC